jgi:hypothetical protein
MSIELSIVMPCLNEAETLERCIAEAREFFERDGISGEVIVADNGSTDGSRQLAAAAGARVVDVPDRGYGAALRAGIEAARGRFVVMGDSDHSYDFSALGPFVERLRAGADLVVGNRFRGGIEPGAMPVLHRYVGNPALSLFARLFFRTPVRDVYCGLRGFTRDAFGRLDVRSAGMEFALEMIVKSSLLRMRVSEVPTVLRRDGRSRPPHLSTWRDGRRSLLLYLASMPRGLFFYPGLVALIGGLGLGAALSFRSLQLGPVSLDVHTLLYCATAVIVGFQLVAYSVCLRLMMVAEHLLPPDPGFVRRLSAIKLEHGVAVGGLLALVGLLLSLGAVSVWREHDFGNLDPFEVMRLTIPAATAITLGLQVVAAAMFLSLVKWQIRSRHSG